MIHPRTKVRGPHLIQGETGVIEHGLIRVQSVPIRSEDNDGLGDGIDDLSELLFILPQLLRRTRLLNGHGRQMRHLVDEVLLVRSRAPGFACVEREGAQYFSLAGHYWRGPTRTQAVG